MVERGIILPPLDSGVEMKASQVVESELLQSVVQASLCKGGVPKGRWVDKIIKNKLFSQFIIGVLMKSVVG